MEAGLELRTLPHILAVFSNLSQGLGRNASALESALGCQGSERRPVDF